MIGSLVRLLLATALLMALGDPSRAHPHVWVTVTTEVVFSPDSTVAAVRHHWSFDEMFSTFATQGLDSDKDGKLSREELQGLTDVNVSSIKEFEFYTQARSSGKKALLTEAVYHWLEYSNGVLTLHFTLNLQKPAAVNSFEVGLSDWSNFVDFKFAKGNAVRLVGAPAHCQLEIVNDSSFMPPSIVSPLGAPVSNRIMVTCP